MKDRKPLVVMALPINPQKTWAILIGTSKYLTLPAIPAVGNNLDKLRKLLIKISGNQIILIGEDKKRSDLITELTRDDLPPKGLDTLIVYYVGHGLRLRLPKSPLYLAAYDSTGEILDTYLGFYSLWTWTHEKANNLLYILDCCYGGNVSTDSDFLLDIEKARNSGKKISVIAATPPNHKIKFDNNKYYTVLTGNLVELLENWPVNEQVLTPEKIHLELKKRFKNQGYCEPYHRDFHTEPFHFAYKPNPPMTPSQLTTTSYSDSFLTPLHLVIALKPPQLKKSKKYRIEAWLFTQEQKNPICVYEEKTISFSLGESKNLLEQIKQIFKNIKNDLTKHHNKLTLEFFLPTDLLVDYPIEEKCLPGSKFSIGFDYNVLIRPWERIAHRFDYAPVPKNKNNDITAFLRLCGQWNGGDKLQKEFGSCAEWLADANQKLADSKKSVFSVNFKPNKEFFDDVINRGIPIVFWIRDDTAKECHARLYNDWLSRCLLKIPESLHEERHSTSKEHIGHISLLWDDPSRIPPEEYRRKEPT